ncbi:MAG: hypothetical protein J6Q51_04705 [Clostridia bacterium]|nr:hypothetical protein [Clostridia bacterium]
MKNFKTIKCSNCASSKYKQISDDIFECEYCGAIIKTEETVKQTFINDMESQKTKKNIYLVKAAVPEDEFLKKAFIYLSLNKNTPLDVLSESRFLPVQCRYVFYAVADVNFEVLNVKNHEHLNPYKSSNISANFEASSIYCNGTKLCIPLTTNTFENQSKFVINDSHIMTSKKYSQKTSINQIQQQGVETPTKDKVEQFINQAIETQKIQMKAYSPFYRIIHKINKIDLFAIPEYSLEFIYKNNKYKLSSFAHKIAVAGNIPMEKQTLKKPKPVCISSIATTITAVLCILFCLFNIVFKYQKLMFYDMLLAAIAIICFITSTTISILAENKISKKLLTDKKTNIKEYLSKQSINLTKDDENYIDLYTGGL